MGRGRKRKSGNREPNGKPSRRIADKQRRHEEITAHMDQVERETLSTGLEARARVFKELPGKVLRDQMAGSFVGRLCLSGEITTTQYDAAMSWLEDSRNYTIAACAAVGRPPSAVDLNRTHGLAGAENIGWTQEAMRRYRAARTAIQTAQDEAGLGAHLFGALNYAVERDMSLNHLVGWLRLALNALAKHYRLDARMAA